MTEERPWRTIDPPEFAKPVGYANAVESRGGRRITLAGQVAMDRSGDVIHRGDLPAQAELAFSNLATVLRHAGGQPEHLVRMRLYVVDIPAYRAASRAIGLAYRKHFGRWFPAMTMVGVTRLYDDGALLEVEAEAVIPDPAE